MRNLKFWAEFRRMQRAAHRGLGAFDHFWLDYLYFHFTGKISRKMKQKFGIGDQYPRCQFRPDSGFTIESQMEPMAAQPRF